MQSILEDISSGLFAANPETVRAHLPLFARLMRGEQLSAAEIAAGEKQKSANKPKMHLSSLADSERTEASYVYLINVRGLISKYGTHFSYGTEELAEMVNYAAADPNCEGIVSLIDSGGGFSNAPSVLKNALSEAGKRLGTVSLIEFAGSAACNIAVSHDEVLMIGREASIGSIGVYGTLVNDSLFYEKLGVTFTDVYSSFSTEKNKYFREYAESGATETFQKKELDPICQFFISDVKEARAEKISDETVFGGDMYFAGDAIKLGLADGIATLNEAIARAAALTKKKNSKFNSKQNMAEDKEGLIKQVISGTLAALGVKTVEKPTVESLQAQLTQKESALAAAYAERDSEKEKSSDLADALAKMTAERDEQAALAKKYGAMPGASHSDEILADAGPKPEIESPAYYSQFKHEF